ncbi:unnamed protein product [Heterobilharzia americana]|nr:unnamed protein product [Heterobilharzia americana]
MTHSNIESILKQPNEISWLLNSAKDLLNNQCTTIKEKKISTILNSVCLRCSPRMLYYALVRGSSSASTSSSTCIPSTPDITSLLPKSGPKTSRITPCVNVLFRVAQKLLFKNIQDIVTNPIELFKETSDSTLVDSVQAYLTGLSSALLEFLRVLPHLPSVDLVPIERETDALSFLLVLIEFFFFSMGYPYTQVTSVCSGCGGGTVAGSDSITQPQTIDKDTNYIPKRHFMISVTLIQNTLRLLNYVLQTASNRSAKGVDLFGGDGKKILSIFLVFVWMIDKSACLSEYTTFWSKSTNEHMMQAVHKILTDCTQRTTAVTSLTELSTTILLNNLLIPIYPPTMGIWWPDPLCASTLSQFCATSVACASFAALNSTSSSNSTTTHQTRSGNINLQGGLIQPCQLIGKCRLIRSNLDLPTGSDTVNQLNICTLGISRLLHTLDVSSSHGYSSMNTSFHESDHVKRSDFLNSFVNMDLDHLTLNITHLSAMGWLDRREFERIWTTYLELLSSASDTNQNIYSVSLESNNAQLTSSEELIECNQSIVIGLRGLTRLLMDTSLKPQPGDTLYSRMHHHSRLGIPHFSHTKLGRKLISMLSFIEQERNYLNKSSEYSMNTYSIHSEYCMNQLNETVDIINLERLTNSFIDGPSQFAVDWSIQRLHMRENLNTKSVWSNNESVHEIDKLQSSIKSSTSRQSLITNLPVSKINPRAPSIVTLQSYEDPLFSCLQSTLPLRSDNEDINSLLWGNSKVVDLFTSNPTTISTSVLNKTPTSKQTTRNNTPSIKGPAFDVWQSILQSAIILSDLFTTQEQFIWLNDHLQDAVKQLPIWNEFQSPIHSWLALGIAKCTAVLELINSSPNNIHVLQSNSLEPAVKQSMNAINSSLLTVQNAGLHSSMYLLHTALLIRTQPYQQQLQQHSPPTGSILLNELYINLCNYLEKKINTIFSNSITTASNLLSTEPSTNNELSLSLTGSSGMKRFMQAVLHPGAASKIMNIPNVERESSMMHISNVDLTDHIESHQLIVLSTAFFLTEHFSGPPVYPIVTDSGMGITEMLSGLTANLFRLAPSMLGDTPVVNRLKSVGYIQSSSLSTGTTVDLSYPLSVHMAWCQGIERLIQTGRLGKGAISSLQKMCISRIRTCRSAHISFLAIRLLLTCMYANLGRLTHRIQHHRQHQFMSTTQKSDDNFNSRIHETKNDQVTVPSENDSKMPSQSTAKFESKVADSDSLESLPSSILQDFENISALIQESLNCLWERFRGGISLVNSPVQSTHGLQIPWTMSAWTSVIEARLIARLLPLISTDIAQTIVSLLGKPDTMNKQFNDSSSIIGCDTLTNSVLNKPLGEFARADHAFPNLAASNLTELFERFMQNENGQNLIRQWILLSFPTLLSRQPSDLAIWACTVCLLAAATDHKLRAALYLCYAYKLPNSESTNSWHTTINNSPVNASLFNSTTNLCLIDLLCLAAYHFVTDGLLKPLPVSESKSTVFNQRQAERNHFLLMIKDHCDTINNSIDDNHNIRRNSYLIEEECKTNYSLFYQLYTIVRQQVEIDTL